MSCDGNKGGSSSTMTAGGSLSLATEKPNEIKKPGGAPSSATVGGSRSPVTHNLDGADAVTPTLDRGDAVPPTKRPLPEGWRWVRLGEVIRKAQPGFACGERDPNGVIQLRMNNVDTRGNCVWGEFIRVPANATTVERYLLKPGDVLFNNTNSIELVRKTTLFMGYTEPVVYSNHFTVLRTKDEYLDAEYLAKFLVWQWQNKVFQHLCNRWIGQSAVKNDKLLSIEIPLPPLSEQQCIAAILCEQMAAVERARRAQEEQLEAVNRLPAAILRKAFEGRL